MRLLRCCGCPGWQWREPRVFPLLVRQGKGDDQTA